MRLLNVNTHQLESYDDSQAPSYAILSHTWGVPDEEVTFQDVQQQQQQSTSAGAATDPKTSSSQPSWKKKSGWTKIESACSKALKSGHQYIWVDTCCIDKSSSAELQEGINSMFRWYEGASICFAYLSDVSSNCDPQAEDSEFRRARWFTRGWTLQELLAPHTVFFYDKDWNLLGTKNSLAAVIEEISGIEARYIGSEYDSVIEGSGSAFGRLSQASVAQRMSWMSRRETTRIEDMAYCLLGIFDIHMPMLYGEGNKAFKRLQEQIMKESDDTTLLSWYYQRSPGSEYLEAESVLAPDPGSFKNCHDLVPSQLPGFTRPSFSLTQRGLVLTLPVKPDINHEYIVYAILACGSSQSLIGPGQCKNLVVVPLISINACLSPALWKDQDEYVRYFWCTPSLVSTEFMKGATTETIVVRRPSQLTQHGHLPCLVRPLRGGELTAMYPPQPVYPFTGTRFVSLGGGGASSAKQLVAKYLTQPDLAVLPSVSLQDGDSITEQDGETNLWMYLIDVSGDQVLMILESHTRIDYAQFQGLEFKSCRLFKAPPQAQGSGLELFHNLSFRRDYVGLREIPDMNREEDNKAFRIKEGGRDFLILKIRRSLGMTEVEMFVRTE